MHHFLQAALAVLALALGVAAPAVLGRLVLQAGEPQLDAPRLLATRRGAIPLAAPMPAAVRELGSAARALLDDQQLHPAAALPSGLYILG